MNSRFLIPGIFFASGASALVFETLWFRQAGLAVGNSLWASSLVLSGFMTGLGVGNLLAARLGDRVQRPLRIYAVLEVAIALAGVALVYGLPRLAPALAPLLDPLLDQPLLANAIRFSVAFVALLVPSTAMGATLPLLTRALSSSASNFGAVFGLLYGCNTLGAVVGPLLVEGALIPAFGIRGSALVAGAANLGIALVAVAVDRGAQPVPRAKPDARSPSRSLRGAILALAAVFGSGFALLALEVLWFRVLLLFVPGSSFAFAVMLSTVLAGIGAGGVAASIWLRRHGDAARHATALAFLAGTTSALGYALFPKVMEPFGTRVLTDAVEIFAIGAALTLPTAAASGALFTLIGARLRKQFGGDAATAGASTLSNTIGAALGSLAAGFLLLPALGTQWALLTIALVYGAVGLLLLPGTRPRGPALAGAASLVVAVAILAGGAPRERFLDIATRRWSGPGTTRMAAREGLTETIVYLQTGNAELPGQRLMITNTFSMSGTGTMARRYMKLFVLLPAALHPKLESALLISYGVGSTARALVDVPSLRSIDVVDISRDVLEMSDLLYPDPATHPLRDPRVRVHVEDGRHFLQMHDERYDLITGEPPPPHVAGVVNLYTQEYFALMRERLNEGGIVTYWLPTHSLDAGQSRVILKAFCNVFEDCSLWAGAGHDLVMVGTRDARGPVSEDSFTRAWRDPALAPELHAIGLERPEMLGATFVGDAEYLRDVTAGVDPLVDDHPERLWKVSALTRRMPVLYREWMDVAANRDRFARSALIRNLWPDALRAATMPYFELQSVVNRGIYRMDVTPRSTLEALDLVLERFAGSAAALWVLDGDVDLRRAAERADSSPASPRVELQLGIGALADGRTAAAIGPLSQAAAVPFEGRNRALLLETYALCRLGRVEDAFEGANEFLRTPSAATEDADSWGWLARKCRHLARTSTEPAP